MMLEEEHGSFWERTSVRVKKTRKYARFSAKILPTRIPVTNETSLPQQVELEAYRGILVGVGDT